MSSDPFAHHPELRPLIVDPAQSDFRHMTSARVINQLESIGLSTDWLYTDQHRETGREAFLASHTGDIWVFGYGSLMWNPALHFAQVRRAHLPGHVRRFILRDTQGGRGTPEAPGLMAALDTGPEGCDGLAFLIRAEQVEHETRILWQREMIGPGYLPVMAPATTADDGIACLTFLADHTAPLIAGDLTRDQQIRYLATGRGFMGTSLDYLRSIARHFDALGINDREVTSLLIEAEAAALA